MRRRRSIFFSRGFRRCGRSWGIGCRMLMRWWRGRMISWGRRRRRRRLLSGRRCWRRRRSFTGGVRGWLPFEVSIRGGGCRRGRRHDFGSGGPFAILAGGGGGGGGPAAGGGRGGGGARG